LEQLGKVIKGKQYKEYAKHLVAGMNEDELSEKIFSAAKIIVKSKRVVALTGAGISVESGIPDFRGPVGLWRVCNPI